MRVLMETAELQKKAAGIVSVLDRKFKVRRDVQLCFTQLMEEIGELARDINLPRLRSKQPDAQSLEGEFADVLLQLSKLAEMHGIDMEKAVLGKIEALKKRHGV